MVLFYFPATQGETGAQRDRAGGTGFPWEERREEVQEPDSTQLISLFF